MRRAWKRSERFVVSQGGQSEACPPFQDEFDQRGWARELICFARKRNFVQEPATRWHDGQITKSLSSPSRKNNPLNLARKSPA
jgi:hypothetical protein